ncbi:NUDIX hydrolase [Paenibacillus thermotolerans]|uniref:NUDIX hydrolase n=1 Tax=Paenibacillus thermotolerans TaxID=3027807 RepID=UPI002367B907|nr:MULTISPECIES: NUDIX hydrolase [unclassified Paenibacillus]
MGSFSQKCHGVVILITTENGIVAILPPNAPKEYPAALPAGHAEYGESPEGAAIREAFEETGFHVEITQLLGWEFIRKTSYPGPMLSFYFEAATIGRGIKQSEEGKAKVYAIEDFPPISPSRGGSKKTFELYINKVKVTVNLVHYGLFRLSAGSLHKHRTV